jgi:hypothetical protein
MKGNEKDYKKKDGTTHMYIALRGKKGTGKVQRQENFPLQTRFEQALKSRKIERIL